MRRGAVEIAVLNQARELRPGMSASVQIEMRGEPHGLRVPVAALDFSPNRVPADGTGLGVWLTVSGNLKRVPVEVRGSDGTFAEVFAPELREGVGVAVGYALTRDAR